MLHDVAGRRFAMLLLALTCLPVRAPALGTAEVTAPPRSVHLRILWWGSQARHDSTLEVLRLYEGTHPEVTFEPVFVDWNGYWDALYVMAAAEDVPDVFQMVIERIPLFASKGILADLEGISGLDVSGIDGAALDLGRLAGRLVAVPLGVNAMALGYSASLFEKSGVAPPSASWTWSELRKAALAIRSASGLWGLNGYGSDNDFAYFIRTRGGQVFDEALRGPGWRRDADVRDFYAMMLDFQDAGVVPPAEDWLEEQAEEENSLFARGGAAMRFLWSNKAVSVARRSGAAFGLAVPPGPEGSRGLFLRPSMFFCVSAASRGRGAAASFISAFVRDVPLNRVLGAERGIPVVDAVRDALGAAADEQTRTILDYVGIVAGRSSPMSLRFPAGEGEYRKAFQIVTRDVAFRRLGAAEAPAVLRKEIERVLAGSGR
jgi:multiple sugar transport system substrate-binding protein